MNRHLHIVMFKAIQQKLVCVFVYQDHPCGVVPLLFEEGQQSLRCDSVASASQGANCRPGSTPTSDFCYRYSVAFEPPSRVSQPIAFDACRSCVS